MTPAEVKANLLLAIQQAEAAASRASQAVDLAKHDCHTWMVYAGNLRNILKELDKLEAKTETSR